MSAPGWLYRMTMRVAHRFHWHYAPPIYPEGDTMLWCHWCGFRAVVKRRDSPTLDQLMKSISAPVTPERE